MATTPSAARKTCTLRAGAPVFVPRERIERSAADFRLNPQAAAYKPSKNQQALDQLFNILTDTSISEREGHSDCSAESSGQRGEESGSVSSSPGRTYVASSASDTLVDDASGHIIVSDSEGIQVSPGQGSSRSTSEQGVLHHHHIHHHHHQPHRRHTDSREVHVHHVEFVGSVLHIEHARHSVPYVHLISSGDMHVQPHETTDHMPYRPCPAPETFPAIPSGTPVPNYRPIPCEAYLLDHPLRDMRTGYWEVPKAQPIKHRYTEADLALFRSTHKDYKQAHGIALYGQTTNGSQDQSVVDSQGQTMAREYHAQNTYEYRDLESSQNVCGRAEGFWYGWY